MPLYAYKCESCGYAFDRRFDMGKAPAAIVCPNCEAQAERRITFPAGVHWRKAGGQYIRPPSAQWVSVEEYEAASAKVTPEERSRRQKRGCA